MPTNEEVVRAMIEHGVPEHVTLAEFWLRFNDSDRAELERAYASEFEKYRALVHYTALAKEAANEPRSVA